MLQVTKEFKAAKLSSGVYEWKSKNDSFHSHQYTILFSDIDI